MEHNREDTLIEEILGDARKKAGRTLRRAEREAKQEVERAQKEAEKITSAAIDSARQRAQKEKQVILATVDLDARRIRLDMEEQVIVEAFEAARKRVLDKSSYDYPAALARLTIRAARAIGGNAFRIGVSEEDRPAVDTNALRQRLKEELGHDVHLTLADEPAPISGGVIVYSGDGGRMVDNSLDSRLARMHDDLRRRIAGILLDHEADS